MLGSFIMLFSNLTTMNLTDDMMLILILKIIKYLDWLILKKHEFDNLSVFSLFL